MEELTFPLFFFFNSLFKKKNKNKIPCSSLIGRVTFPALTQEVEAEEEEGRGKLHLMAVWCVSMKGHPQHSCTQLGSKQL